MSFTDSSSQSDRKVVEKKPEPAPEKKPRVNTSALKRNSNIKTEIQAELEQALIKKLENLGVKPVCCIFLISNTRKNMYHYANL